MFQYFREVTLTLVVRDHLITHSDEVEYVRKEEKKREVGLVKSPPVMRFRRSSSILVSRRVGSIVTTPLTTDGTYIGTNDPPELGDHYDVTPLFLINLM